MNQHSWKTSDFIEVKTNLQRYISGIILIIKTAVSSNDSLDPGPQALAGLRHGAPVEEPLKVFRIYRCHPVFVIVYRSVLDPHWFNADPDPAFCLSAEPGPGSQTNADRDPGQTLKAHKISWKEVLGQKPYLRRYKRLFERHAPGSGSESSTAKLIRIYADPHVQHCLSGIFLKSIKLI